MIDLHSHVLPGIDDGSKNVEESLAMLWASARQGIGYVAATPHFYPMENSPEQFLERRRAAAEQLRAVWQPGLPRLLLGAEVYYFTGISQSIEIETLCLGGTLLLEMPFCPWTNRMLAEAIALREQRRLNVVLAHIERYFRWQPKELWEKLLNRGLLMQCNASFFVDWKTRRRAQKLLAMGRIHLLGSDAHNMTSRPPRMGEARSSIGEAGWRTLEQNAYRLLPELEETKQ